MTGDGLLALSIQMLVGVCLAACCGLRAFLPPFVFGLAVRLGLDELVLGQPVELHSAFEWMSSTPALVVFGVAVLAEFSADKFPVVDHALDLVQTAVRPLAGMLVAAASLSDLDPLPAAVVGLLVGGSVATSVHVVKSQVRVVSTLGTGGLATPVVSLVEDAVALVGSILAVTAALIAAVLLLAALLVGLSLMRAARRRARDSGARLATGQAAR
ncbi:MAG: DUF4126 domain-containing protein [Acidobacteriota bacterium]|nr:DUF4126 domain-containing protein [Acidobacteriota bacterium]